MKRAYPYEGVNMCRWVMYAIPSGTASTRNNGTNTTHVIKAARAMNEERTQSDMASGITSSTEYWSTILGELGQGEWVSYLLKTCSVFALRDVNERKTWAPEVVRRACHRAHVGSSRDCPWSIVAVSLAANMEWQ